jgi:hypothetical protein
MNSLQNKNELTQPARVAPFAGGNVARSRKNRLDDFLRLKRGDIG